MTPAQRFWGSAAAVSIGLAALVPALFPFRALGLDPALERDRVWMLVVFCAGVMLLLFGLSALAGGFSRLGVRDVMEAGGVRQALERLRQRRPDPAAGYTRNFAWWCVATGGLLVVIYFALWLALR